MLDVLADGHAEQLAPDVALAAVSRACTKILSAYKPELFLSILTDRSFEEGTRARDFAESLATLRRSGLPEESATIMDGGVNGMLARSFTADPLVQYLGQSPSRGADHRLIIDGRRVSVETKIVYDLTLPKYYPQVASGREKCLRERATGAADDAIQVVFFFELPAFDYPAGTWYAGKCCTARKGYPGTRGIAAQYAKVSASLGRATWPQDAPLLADLSPTAGEFESALCSPWMRDIFTPATDWTFDPTRHAAGARAGVAVWAW